MGFEITEKHMDTDLTVIFDQKKEISVSGREIHAPFGNTKEEIYKIYEDVLDTAYGQKAQSLEVTMMKHACVSEIHVYPIALQVITAFLEDHEMDIYLYQVKDYYYVNKHRMERDMFDDIDRILNASPLFQTSSCSAPGPALSGNVMPAISPSASLFYDEFGLGDKLDEMLKKNRPVSFGERLVQLIDEKGYAKDSLVYNKAMIDRRLYHNIISKKDYQPGKNTVILLALALELNEEEAKDFLAYAGYSFSESFKDQIILYCIQNHYYKIMYINGYLYDKGLSPLLTIEA